MTSTSRRVVPVMSLSPLSPLYISSSSFFFWILLSQVFPKRLHNHVIWVEAFLTESVGEHRFKEAFLTASDHLTHVVAHLSRPRLNWRSRLSKRESWWWCKRCKG